MVPAWFDIRVDLDTTPIRYAKYLKTPGFPGCFD